MNLNKKDIKKIILIITISIVIFLGLQNISVVYNSIKFLMGLMTPLIFGFCTAFILNVPLKVIEGRIFAPLNKKNFKIWNKCRRPLCIVLTFGIIVGILYILLFLIVPQLKNTFDIMVQNMPNYFEQIEAWINRIMESLKLSEDVVKEIQDALNKLGLRITEFLKNEAPNFLNATVEITTSIFSGVFNFVVGIAFSIYALSQKEKLGGQFKRLLYAYIPERKADRIVYIGGLSHKIFSRFVTGQFTEAIIIGILCFIGMKIFSMPYATMISALVGFTALIPIFGAFIGTGIGAFLILMVDPIKAFWFIIFIIVLQQLEGNLIYPKVVGSMIELPGIWVLAAVTIGGNLFGVMGMIISVPLFSIIYCLLRESVKFRSRCSESCDNNECQEKKEENDIPADNLLDNTSESKDDADSKKTEV